MYDMIIIGAGPAGISAAIYGKSRGKKVLVLEKKQVGGLIGTVSTVTHYTAIVREESGRTFAERMKEQALGAGVEIRYENVEATGLEGEIKKVVTDKESYESKTIILANGGSGRMLGIPGENLKGVRLNAPKDGLHYKGKNVYVIGGADGAVKEALYLAEIAGRVTIVCVEDELACIQEFKDKVVMHDNIKIMAHSSLTAVYGSEAVEELEFTDNKTGNKQIVKDAECGVFVYAGIVPNTQMYTELKLEGGYIPVDDSMQTQIPGVFAAGDIRVKKVRQVATAVADGAIAGIQAAAMC
ncbi:NAD(P)/FAD-dependent oxidoreductase [Parablautia intestinalis]|jgi:thioredoxin reductase (NADPH)|uniref:NAD(P)/FAD-dependent oxidoreductase n=1 Tax=Parablautia intestinalis TaxID=2320100 RepID=UPI00256EA4C9|nr:FAD-dependent oxidoreductase [Parablautia intestinalis]